MKGWQFSFLPLLVLVIRFAWEVGCVFLIPSNSAARRLDLRAHSRRHGNQQIAATPSRALCVPTRCYCSPVITWETRFPILIKEDSIIVPPVIPRVTRGTAASFWDAFRFTRSDFRKGWFAPRSLCAAPSRPRSSETRQRIWSRLWFSRTVSVTILSEIKGVSNSLVQCLC